MTIQQQKLLAQDCAAITEKIERHFPNGEGLLWGYEPVAIRAEELIASLQRLKWEFERVGVML